MYSQSLMSYAVIKERYHERLHSSIEIRKEDFSQLESASNLHLVYFRYMSRFTTAAIQEELEPGPSLALGQLGRSPQTFLRYSLIKIPFLGY